MYDSRNADVRSVACWWFCGGVFRLALGSKGPQNGVLRFGTVVVLVQSWRGYMAIGEIASTP